MINEIKIKRAKPQDVEHICDLWKEFMDFHRERDRIFTRSFDGHKKFATFISDHMSKDTSSVLVAECHKEIIGYCLAWIGKYPAVFEIQEYGYISDLAVTEVWRRQGIGRKLLEEAQKWFFERNIHRLELRVLSANDLSASFWKKMDFITYTEMLYKNI